MATDTSSMKKDDVDIIIFKIFGPSKDFLAQVRYDMVRKFPDTPIVTISMRKLS